MQITVINLASQPVRWAATSCQFDAAGLEPVRHDAIAGADLSASELNGLYSERLNARRYHRSLSPGEVACYASHLSVWRQLLDSGAPAMAIFEDDIEIEPDLTEVLDCLARSDMSWDVVKLIGRDREKVGARDPLTGRRELVRYTRVPSLTGAYVITARGAQKMLARRQPFGRPVDVDLRHWWECDIDVRGVLPYPVRGAASSGISTISDRRTRSRFAHRLKKLRFQARYTWSNWRANRLRAAHRHVITAGAPPPVPMAPALQWPAAKHPNPGLTGKRNLVIVRAGDTSLHPAWLSGGRRDFDIFISYYGATPGRYRHDGEHYEMRPGPKWPCLLELLEANRDLLADYESFWFPDDDLLTDSATIDRMFAFIRAYELCLAQPALTRNSFYTWNTLLQDKRCHIRYARFVEVMAPAFSREALRVCAPTFAQSRSGWGLDWIWPRLCDAAGLGRIGIIDATPVRHTRPVGGELYRNHRDMDPRADAARILARYGIAEVRAVAKYSFEGQVREVPLPLGERLVLWLKRLNGLRKHRAHA